MVKAVHISQVSAGAEGMMQHQRREQDRMHTGIPTNTSHRTAKSSHALVHPNGSYNMYPPPYYPRNPPLNGSNHATVQNHRGPLRSHRPYSSVVRGTPTYVDGPSRYMAENAPVPSRSQGTSYTSKHAQSHRYTSVDARRVDQRQYDPSFRRYPHPRENRFPEGDMCPPPLGYQHTMDPPPGVLPSYNKTVSKGSERYRDGRQRPLQTIVPNKQEKTQIVEQKPSTDKTPCNSSRNHNQENGANVSKLFKSPVTMCFERMLGAGKCVQMKNGGSLILTMRLIN